MQCEKSLKFGKILNKKSKFVLGHELLFFEPVRIDQTVLNKVKFEEA